MAGPISEILSTTLKNYVADVAFDNIFNSHALFFELKRRGAIRGFGGGERLVAPLEYATNATVAAMGKAGQINLTEQDVISSAEYNWGLYGASVVLFDYDLERNKGDHQIVNLLEAKARNAIASVRQKLLTDTFATSQTVNGLLNWQSIFRSTGTIGGISQTTYTWWASQYDNTAEPLTVEDMFNMYNSTSGGSDNPNVVVTSQTLYEKYNSLLQANQRFTDSAMADAGFVTLKFHGANVIWDQQAISDEMWFWNTKYLYLGAIPDHVKSFGVKPFEQMTSNGQLGRVSIVWFMAQYVATNRRRLGALDRRTA